MITHPLYGGIGNQLFQLCTLIALSLKTEHEFFLEYRTDTLVEGCSLLAPIHPYCKLEDECQALKEHMGVQIVPEDVARRSVDPPSGANLESVVVLEGYFQAHRHFSGDIDAILRILRIREQQAALYAALRRGEWAVPTCPSIVMHFRLGDYKRLQHTHPILPCGYYIRALREILGDDAASCEVVYVCHDSDRPMVNNYYVSRLARVFPNVSWTPISPKMTDAEQLLYMSLAEHLIMANSTFSLWSAYFNDNEYSHVYYPESWYTPSSGYTWVTYFEDEDTARETITFFLPCSWTTCNPVMRAEDMLCPPWHRGSWRAVDCTLDESMDCLTAPDAAETVDTAVSEPDENVPCWCLCFGNAQKHESMTRRFAELGRAGIQPGRLTLEIYPGVPFTDARILNHSTRNNTLNVQRLWSVTYGHLDMIRRFYRSGKQYGIFCEDDIVVHRALSDRLPQITRECEQMRVDFLLLGYMTTHKIVAGMPEYPVVGSFSHGEYTHVYHEYPENQWGVHMYMVSREGAKRILDTFADGYADEHVGDDRYPFSPDWTISKCPGVRRALISPMYAVEDGKDSYAHYAHEGQWRFHMETFRANYDPHWFI